MKPIFSTLGWVVLVLLTTFQYASPASLETPPVLQVDAPSQTSSQPKGAIENLPPANQDSSVSTTGRVLVREDEVTKKDCSAIISHFPLFACHRGNLVYFENRPEDPRFYTMDITKSHDSYFYRSLYLEFLDSEEEIDRRIESLRIQQSLNMPLVEKISEIEKWENGVSWVGDPHSVTQEIIERPQKGGPVSEIWQKQEKDLKATLKTLRQIHLKGYVGVSWGLTKNVAGIRNGDLHVGRMRCAQKIGEPIRKCSANPNIVHPKALENHADIKAGPWLDYFALGSVIADYARIFTHQRTGPQDILDYSQMKKSKQMQFSLAEDLGFAFLVAYLWQENQSEEIDWDEMWELFEFILTEPSLPTIKEQFRVDTTAKLSTVPEFQDIWRRLEEVGWSGVKAKKEEEKTTENKTSSVIFGLSGWAVVVLAAGGVFVLAIILFVTFWACRRSEQGAEVDGQDTKKKDLVDDPEAPVPTGAAKK